MRFVDESGARLLMEAVQNITRETGFKYTYMEMMIVPLMTAQTNRKHLIAESKWQTVKVSVYEAECAAA